MQKHKNTDKLLNDAVDNIENDRACASKLLSEVMVLIATQNDADAHRRLGEVAAKYLETLQRSNEQLVKLAGVAVKMSGAKAGLSKDDINSIYDEVVTDK